MPDHIDNLQDLIQRMQVQLRDPDTRLLHLHWSDVELLRLIRDDLATDAERIQKLKDGLSQAVDQAMRRS